MFYTQSLYFEKLSGKKHKSIEHRSSALKIKLHFSLFFWPFVTDTPCVKSERPEAELAEGFLTESTIDLSSSHQLRVQIRPDMKVPL